MLRRKLIAIPVLALSSLHLPLGNVAVASASQAKPAVQRTSHVPRKISRARMAAIVRYVKTLQRASFHQWIVGVYLQRWLAAVHTAQPVEHYNWNAVANCETGGNWDMVGSYYSTGLGIMNAAIWENSPPSVAALEVSGRASRSQIVATAESIAARHGIDSWGCAGVA